MKKLYGFLFPKFTRLPLLLVISWNMAVYYLTPIFVSDNTVRFDLTVGLDLMLPLVTPFILVYVLSYVQWAGTYLLNCRESAELCYKMVTGDMIAKFISMLFFIFLPTQIIRPEIEVNGFFDWATQFIYNVDKPINLFPSLHCLESWVCFRSCTMMKKKNGWYIAAQFVFTLLVFASTVMVKQHFVVDIIAGVVIAEIGLFISGKLKAWKLLEKIQTPSAKAFLAHKI